MPGGDGITGTAGVLAARSQCRVLVLTMFDLDEYVYGALRAGASGFLLKTAAPAELTAAIRACHAGEFLFAPSVTRRLVESYVKSPPGPDPRLGDLTPRELDVLRELARGRSNAEIAAALYLGERRWLTTPSRAVAHARG